MPDPKKLVTGREAVRYGLSKLGESAGTRRAGVISALATPLEAESESEMVMFVETAVLYIVVLNAATILIQKFSIDKKLRLH